MLAGTRKLMGNKYSEFCEAMIAAAEKDALPISIVVENTFGMTFQDISDLCKEFEKDTGLELTGHLFMCHECNQLHVQLDVDYPEEEEEEDKRYLQ